MKKFMDGDFLLSTETAKTLFHTYAKNQPIIDYHCHIDPKDIAQDRHFDNITQLWLGGDHYKWRLMRSAGVDEKYITGDASDHDKFIKWAEVLGRAIGNPLFHWSHLELQRYFDYHGVLNKNTAEDVWELCNKRLASADMSAKNIIRNSAVEVVCTTDDPADTLEWHKQIAEDTEFDVKVAPAWRPDRALNIEKSDFTEYISKLAGSAQIQINSWDDLKKALTVRMAYFDKMGCRVSDHAPEYIYYSHADDAAISAIFEKRLNEGGLSEEEEKQYKTELLLFLGREYHRLGWVMQLHCGALRNNNTKMFGRIGADTGYDTMNNYFPVSEAAAFLNALDSDEVLPKTILYSLDPTNDQAIDALIGCFQCSDAVGKIQHGAAWWFNDNKTGITDHLVSLGNLGYLAGFVGMLTDSRSFLSYTRHEYFRRILCDHFGRLVENGEFPCDMEILGEIVTDISYRNARDYFGF